MEARHEAAVTVRLAFPRTRLVLLLLATAAGPALAGGQGARASETPERFVRRLYARYRTNVVVPVSTERPEGEASYAAALLDAFAKDAVILHGAVCVIDADPFYTCQANDDLRVTRLAMTAAEANAVTARVTLFNLGRLETVTLTLSKTPAGWRIADVANAATKSLMASLQDEIAQPDQ